MDILDRLLAHDGWTTRQLLEACQGLSDELLDKEFEIDHQSLRETFVHIIENMEWWTDRVCARSFQSRTGTSIPELMDRLGLISRDFADVSRRVAREGRYDDAYVDHNENPPVRRTFGGSIAHVITHDMHHRAQVMFLMEKVGLQEHIEGDLLSWEFISQGWG